MRFDCVASLTQPTQLVYAFFDCALSPQFGGSQLLLQAMEVFEEVGAWVLPVIDGDGRFLGTLSKSTLFDRYRRELIVQTSARAE